jgi:hypothetical protein
MNDLKKVSRGSQCEGTYALVSCAMPRRSAMMLALAVSAASAYEGKVSVMLTGSARGFNGHSTVRCNMQACSDSGVPNPCTHSGHGLHMHSTQHNGGVVGPRITCPVKGGQCG